MSNAPDSDPKTIQRLRRFRPFLPFPLALVIGSFENMATPPAESNFFLLP
ncbi:MAG TPA: hypothetical protein VIC00_00635 [Candidatus Acidoferrales bacterium]